MHISQLLHAISTQRSRGLYMCLWFSLQVWLLPGCVHSWQVVIKCFSQHLHNKKTDRQDSGQVAGQLVDVAVLYLWCWCPVVLAPLLPASWDCKLFSPVVTSILSHTNSYCHCSAHTHSAATDIAI